MSASQRRSKINTSGGARGEGGRSYSVYDRDKKKPEEMKSGSGESENGNLSSERSKSEPKYDKKRSMDTEFGQLSSEGVKSDTKFNIRTTKASRLRAAANLTGGKQPSAEGKTRRSKGFDSPSSTSSSGAASRESTPRPKAENKDKEKDKSSRRKSNLNRSFTEETWPAPNYGETSKASRMKPRTDDDKTPVEVERKTSGVKKDDIKKNIGSATGKPEGIKKKADGAKATQLKIKTDGDTEMLKKAEDIEKRLRMLEIDIKKRKVSTKKSEKEEKPDTKSVRIEESKPKTILKKTSLDETNSPVSILKHKEDGSSMSSSPSRPPSILKKRSSFDEPSTDEDSRRSSREEVLDSHNIVKLRQTTTTRPILKKKSSDDLSDDNRRPILKKKASTEEDIPRPILKSGRRSADDEREVMSSTSSPIRRSPCIPEEADTTRPTRSPRVHMFLDDTPSESRPGPSSAYSRDNERRGSNRRFSTQPVTCEEVVEAIKMSSVERAPSRLVSNAADDDEPSQLSLADRILLFNSMIKAQSGFGVVRKKPPSRYSDTPSRSNKELFMADNRPRGILKHASSVPPDNKHFSEPEEVDIVKGILKIPATVISRNKRKQCSVKSAMKKESSFEDSTPRAGILKPESTEWSEASSSEDDGVIKNDLAAILNSVADSKFQQSSDECDTSSSGGREVKNILVSELRLNPNSEIMVLNENTSTVNGNRDTPIHEDTTAATTTAEAATTEVMNRLSLSPGHRQQQQKLMQSDTANPNETIAERLAALKLSFENDWKKRVTKSSPDEADSSTQPTSTSGGKLADKLNLLDKSSQDWKKRIGRNDAIDFTVAGRMGATAITPPITLSDRQKKTPKITSFQSKLVETQVKKSASEMVGKEISKAESSTVEVPSPNDETFAAFYSSSTTTSQSTTSQIVDFGEFKDITQHTLLVQNKKNIQVQRRKAASRNPVKSLAARTDLLSSYTEVRTGVAEREMKRLNVEKLAKGSNLAVEALAGLASKEDFTAVALKKASDKPPNSNLTPHKTLSLILVKGRRFIQTRLVQPVAKSVNSGDSYVLVTPNSVYNFLGKLSNIIERNRSAEVAAQIFQERDFGSKKAGSTVITIDEAKPTSSINRRAFWKFLGVEDGNGAAQPAGPPDEDEIYEADIAETNVVYDVFQNNLLPSKEHSGRNPRVEMLNPVKEMVFDFGTELYLWCGKDTPAESRRKSMLMLGELYANEFDYVECEVSPFGDLKKGRRPEWAIVGKVTQHMESILFRSKFLDWPEYHKIKGLDNERKNEGGGMNILQIEPTDLTGIEWTEPDLELENSHLGRGDNFYDPETNRHFVISTTAVTIWYIDEFGCEELDEISFGNFHSHDCYVIRWNYSLTVSGRGLSGAPSKHAMVGRHRCAYFLWHGSNASPSEQGAAALLTVELDKEQGPHVRVEQGSEPAAFLRLFNGSLTIHSGRRVSGHTTGGIWKLYLVKCGAYTEEASFEQVPCQAEQLRSRTSVILLHTETGRIFVWHGKQSSEETKNTAFKFAQNIRDKTHTNFGFEINSSLKVTEITEGNETSEFCNALGGIKKEEKIQDKDKDTDEDEENDIDQLTTKLPAIKVFHLSSISGSFIATEVLSPSRTKDPPLAFPINQSELYNASQPALFLIDSGNELWLWQGWWPEDNGEEACGSAALRWQSERRAAMQTAVGYWNESRGEDVKIKAYLVWAGLEPEKFINLFHTWTKKDEVTAINTKDGRKPGEIMCLTDELTRLTDKYYPLSRLILRPLPDGVDPTRVEDYLAPHNFPKIFGCEKSEFYKLPEWRRTTLKKHVGLF